MSIKWLTTGAVAELLGVSSTTVIKWHNTNRMPADFVTPTGRRLYKQDRIARMLEQKNKSELITTGAVAELLGVSSTTVVKWHDTGRMLADFVMPNGRRLYKPERIQKMLEHRNNVPDPDPVETEVS